MKKIIFLFAIAFFFNLFSYSEKKTDKYIFAVMDFVSPDVKVLDQYYGEESKVVIKQKMKMLKDEFNRQILLGADYLSAYLSAYPIFKVVDRINLKKILREKGLLENFNPSEAEKIGQLVGATHIICVTVSDPQIKVSHYKGYGIEINKLIYSIDSIVKVINTKNSYIDFGDEVKTVHTIKLTNYSTQEVDLNVIQTLIRENAKEIAKKIYKKFEEKGKKELPVALPQKPKVTFIPKNEKGDPINAELYVNGEYYSDISKDEPLIIELPAGTCKIEIRAPGYKTWERKVRITNGAKIMPRLEKNK